MKRYQGWPKVPAWRCEEWEASGDGFLEASFSPTSPQQHLDVDIWNVVNDTVFDKLENHRLPTEVAQIVKESRVWRLIQEAGTQRKGKRKLGEQIGRSTRRSTNYKQRKTAK